jgi:hypothetical protein
MNRFSDLPDSLDRRTSPEEQARRLIVPGSREASSIDECNFTTDASIPASIAAGQIDLNALLAQTAGQKP